MNWPLYALHILILIAVFALAVVPALTKNPTGFVSDFPPEIRKVYYASQQTEPPKAALTKAELLRKVIFMIVLLFLFAWMAKTVGAVTYWQSCGVIFSYLAAVAAFDTFILDWIFFPRIKKWRLPGTEHMDREYRQKWFHLKVVLQVSPLFLVYVLLAGAVFLWLF